MSTNVGSIHYDLRLNRKGFDKDTDSVTQKIKTLTKRFAKLSSASFLAFSGFGVKTAADFETARSALTGLLGSVEEADKTMARIKKEAAATPFELTGLTEGVKQLSSVVKTGDDAIDILLSVGKAVTASGGSQVELDRVVFNLKQIQGLGEISAIDLKELRRAVPIFDKLVLAAGTTVEEIRESKDPAKALFDVFEDGGKKLEAVDKAFIIQAGNFNQLVSNMKDSFAIFASDFVKNTGIFDAAKNAVAGLTNFVVQNEEKMTKFVINITKQFSKWWPQIKEVAKQVAEYLGPKLQELWKSITTKLIPALADVWKNYIKPLVPVVGTLLVGAVGLFIDALKLLSDNINIILPVLATFGAMLLGWQVLGAIDKVKVAIIAQGGLKNAMINFAKWLGNASASGGVLAHPWLLISAAAVGAFLAIRSAADQTIAKFDEFDEAVNRLADKQKEAHRLFKAGQMDAKQYRETLRETAREMTQKSIEAKAASDRLQGLQGFKNWVFSGFREKGGPVQSGRAYVVGEAGPEMFVPDTSGKIVSNEDLNKIGNTYKTTSQTTNFYGPVNIDKEADAQQILRTITRNQMLEVQGVAT